MIRMPPALFGLRVLQPVALWHGDHDLQSVDAVILPGGFSYGDYLRCGAISARSPIMTEVITAAGHGSSARDLQRVPDPVRPTCCPGR